MKNAFVRNWCRIAVTTLCCVIALTLYIYFRLDAEIRDCYAALTAADMVIEHLKANKGAWPKSWDELQDDYESWYRRTPFWNFDDLRSRVDIDWNADSTALIRDSSIEAGKPFKVVFLREGSGSPWQLRKPNQKILDYLRSQAPAKSGETDVSP